MPPSFVSQIQSFSQAAAGWIAGLAIPTTGLMVGYHAWARSTATDEMAAMQHSKSLKNTLVYGVGTILAGGIVNAVLGSFH